MTTIAVDGAIHRAAEVRLVAFDRATRNLLAAALDSAGDTGSL